MALRSLADSRTILTGASSGIGWELALQLADQKARLVITARRREPLDELADEIRHRGGSVEVVCGDVTDPQIRQQLVQTAVQTWGGVDLLINNAGAGAMGNFSDASADRLRQIMEVNFFAPVELIRLALPLLRESNQPAIVNIGSVLGHRAMPQKSEYSASKFALHGFSDALRAELASQQIDVVLVSPSTTDSPFFDQAIEDTTSKDWKKRGAMAPADVARQTLRALKRGKHEVILSRGGKLLVWMDRLFPTWVDRLVAKHG